MPPTFCHLCGSEIEGCGNLFHHPEWPNGQHVKVCYECTRTKPRCKKCGIPVVSFTAGGMCQTCVQIDNVCLTCGVKISGRYWEVDGTGPYCDRCTRERPPCEVCSAPLGKEHWRLSDGRVFCSHCRETGVFGIEDAKILYDESKRVVHQQMGLTLNIPTALVMVDRSQLADVIKDQSNGSLQLDIDKTMGIYARRGMKRGIYVQTGLPRILFLQVASHEYAHAWQGENCPLLRDITLREGFAEWVAYHVLGYYGYKDQMTRMKTRDDIYGRGLEMVLALEAKAGVAGVIEACRSSR